MTPHYADDWLSVYHGDARAVMAEMEPESVHCVVTSPPYWGLRDYGTATWEGGDEACDHRKVSPGTASIARSGLEGGQKTNGHQQEGFGASCGKCGATRQDSQLGLEPTPEAYVENMVAVFREVRRVLRSDGTVWLNLGDSYASGTIGRNDDESMPRPRGGHVIGSATPGRQGTRQRPLGMKPKDLVGIPWRVAFALQADGWYLRSDIIWSKPNPMPESVTDRPTKSHEYLFLLSKSPRYYYDADAVREPHDQSYAQRRLTPPGGAKGKESWRDDTGQAPHSKMGSFLSDTPTVFGNPGGRNMRSVWTVATQPYPGAHFATFPPKLIEPCIKAGCPELGTVLDPFAGSGTTGLVAQRLSRRAVLIDLSMDYLDQLMERNRDMPLGLGA